MGRRVGPERRQDTCRAHGPGKPHVAATCAGCMGQLQGVCIDEAGYTAGAARCIQQRHGGGGGGDSSILDANSNCWPEAPWGGMGWECVQHLPHTSPGQPYVFPYPHSLGTLVGVTPGASGPHSRTHTHTPGGGGGGCWHWTRGVAPPPP